MGFALSGVGFAHPGKTIFNDLDLTLQAGRFTGIIGPNGCGKTTLLDLICRHRPPHKGNIFYGGRSLAEFGKRALAREIALVPQDYGVNFPFTVEEVVFMGRYPHTPRFGAPSADDLERVEPDHGCLRRAGIQGSARYDIERGGAPAGDLCPCAGPGYAGAGPG